MQILTQKKEGVKDDEDDEDDEDGDEVFVCGRLLCPVDVWVTRPNSAFFDALVPPSPTPDGCATFTANSTEKPLLQASTRYSTITS